MIIRSISLKGVSGVETPASLVLEPGTSRHVLPPRLASAIPSVLMTLLYPEEVSATDIARLAGPSASSAWRAEFEENETRFRVTRGFSNDSLLLELRDGKAWKVAAQGAGEVRRALGSITKLPPPTVMETLNFWINVNDRPTDVPAPKSSGDSGMLLGTTDYFGNFSDEDREVEPLDEDTRRATSDEYRRACTIEFVEQQILRASERLEDLIGRMGALVDETGEMAKLTRELSRLPEVRALTEEERAVFDDPDAQLGEIEERLARVEDELTADARRTRIQGTTLARNHSFVFGAFGTVVLTLYSIIGGPEARRWALLNVVTMGLMLAGCLQHIANQSNAAAMRKRELLERRLDGLTVRRADLQTMITRLRDELPVATLAELERVGKRRVEIEQRLAALKQRSVAAYETPDYLKLVAKKERAERKLRDLEMAKSRLGASDGNSFELENTLTGAGIDPAVAMWRPEPPTVEIRRRVKRLGQVASKYRLINADGLNPKTVSSWMRIARRIVKDELPELNISPEHELITEAGEDALTLLEHDTATVVVEAFRMSLHLTLVKAKAPGVYGFGVDVHPDRISNPVLRARLDKMYKGLGDRLQAVVLTADA